MQDRLWFFSTFRRWGVDQTITDSFYNLDPTHRTYQPDLSRPTVDDNVIKSGAVRLTFQMSRQHKFSAYLDRIVKFADTSARRCRRKRRAASAVPSATSRRRRSTPATLEQQAADRGRLVGKRRDLLDQRGAAKRRSRPTSAATAIGPRPNGGARVRSVRTTSASPIATPSPARCPT